MSEDELNVTVGEETKIAENMSKAPDMPQPIEFDKIALLFKGEVVWSMPAEGVVLAGGATEIKFVVENR